MQEEEGLYYLCSENKDADQLRGYREADLRLCFSICKKASFLTTWLICLNLRGRGCYGLNFMSHQKGERGCLEVEPLTPEREVGGSIPTSAVLCPWAKTHLLPEKYW